MMRTCTVVEEEGILRSGGAAIVMVCWIDCYNCEGRNEMKSTD